MSNPSLFLSNTFHRPVNFYNSVLHQHLADIEFSSDDLHTGKLSRPLPELRRTKSYSGSIDPPLFLLLLHNDHHQPIQCSV